MDCDSSMIKKNKILGEHVRSKKGYYGWKKKYIFDKCVPWLMR